MNQIIHVNKHNTTMMSPLGGNCSFTVVNFSRAFTINT